MNFNVHFLYIDSNRSVDVSGDKASNKESYPKPEKKLPVCPYGSKCYRKNPIHLKEYFHPRSPGNEKDMSTCGVIGESLGFYKHFHQSKY